MIAINWILGVYLVATAVCLAVGLAVDRLNARRLATHGQSVPPPFDGVIDAGELATINRYTRDKLRWGMVRSLFMTVFFVAVILSGALPRLATVVSGLHPIAAGLLFFAGVGAVFGAVGIPFDLYLTFGIEARYGFNTKTIRIWLADLLKSVMIGTVLGGALLAALLGVIGATGSLWWLWAWGVFIGFQLLMTVLYPTVIAPLFNRFSPLEGTELARRIRQMADDQGLRIDGIFQMDASRRTRHTNAYVAGLGRAKRIVLFDSLVDSHEPDEILAVLAHEIGHWRRRHLAKNLAWVGASALALFAAAALVMEWRALYPAFGFSAPSDYVGLFLVGVLWEPVGFFLSPLHMALSRRHEREADRYALAVMGSAAPMIAALRRLAKDNLANLHPHPLYVVLNYTHPPLLERIDHLSRAAAAAAPC